MIEKLKSKIFLIIMISVSSIVLGVIILFTLYNYQNTIRTATAFTDRMGEKPEELDGVYFVMIEGTKVINRDSRNTEEVENYAIEAAKQGKESGIIGNYFYRQERRGPKEIQENSGIVIKLIESQNAISHLRAVIIISVLGAFVALIIIYIIAKKISETIAKPIEETFSKQVQFISDASHELKTPLAVIEANADVLENEQGPSKWLTYIQKEIDSMNKLINELLLLAKIENIDTLQTNEEFDLTQQTQMISSMFESVAYEKQVKISLDIQENVKMNGNKEDIEHILSTLLDNAIKHTEPEKEVVVELKKEKENIVLRVKNVGQPIPEEERNKIFERFYRVDKSRNRNEKRYGLGLAIAKSTVDKYNGSIEVECREGFTIFEVRIPGRQ